MIMTILNILSDDCMKEDDKNLLVVRVLYCSKYCIYHAKRKKHRSLASNSV